MTTEFPPFPNGADFNAKFDGAVSDPTADTTALASPMNGMNGMNGMNAMNGMNGVQKGAVIDAGLRSLDHCMTVQHAAVASARTANHALNPQNTCTMNATSGSARC